MRAILALFEGVATGAADGYARMAGRPGGELLHLGPGLGNGLANLHNARRARTPVVNIVGDHATYHTQYDAPLQSDIETRRAQRVGLGSHSRATPATSASDAAEAVAAAIGPPGQVATLILPADVSWSDGAEPAPPAPPPARRAVADDVVEGRRGARGPASRPRSCSAVARCASRAWSRPAGSPPPPARTALPRCSPPGSSAGAGLPAVERLATSPSSPGAARTGYKHLILVDATAPVSFFAYPGKASYLVPDGCEVHSSPRPRRRRRRLERAGRRGRRAGDAEPGAPRPSRPERPTGELTAETVAEAIGAMLPEGAIVSDEAQTSGRGSRAHRRRAAATTG